MKHWLAHDIKALLLACSAWLAFLWAGGAYWGLFVPLGLVSILIPAVLTGMLDGPQLARPVIGAIPSVLVVACLALIPSGPDSWFPLIIQFIGGGALLVFLVRLPLAIWRQLRPNNSFKPTAQSLRDRSAA